MALSHGINNLWLNASLPNVSLLWQSLFDPYPHRNCFALKKLMCQSRSILFLSSIRSKGRTAPGMLLQYAFDDLQAFAHAQFWMDTHPMAAKKSSNPNLWSKVNGGRGQTLTLFLPYDKYINRSINYLRSDYTFKLAEVCFQMLPNWCPALVLMGWCWKRQRQ